MRLDYRRAPGVATVCPDEEAFRQLVGIFAKGEDPFQASATNAVRVALDRRGASFRATIAVIGPNGAQRGRAEEHTSRECLGAALEAASTAYLIVTPFTLAEPAQPAATPPPASSTPKPSENLQPSPPPPRKMDVTIGLSGLVLLTAGLTDNVGPGVGLMADVRYEWFSLGLELRGVFPARTYARTPSFPDDATKKMREVEMDNSQVSAALVPCVRWSYLLGCGVAQAGMLLSQTTFDTIAVPLVMFGPRLGLEVPFAERFAVFGFGEALFLGYGQGFGYDLGPNPANVFWEPSIISGFFAVGLSATFK